MQRSRCSSLDGSLAPPVFLGGALVRWLAVFAATVRRTGIGGDGASGAILGLSVLFLQFAAVERLASQEPGLEARCAAPDVQLLRGEKACLATVQAITSVQPLLGILVAGGNPTLGSAGASGLRLGVLPGFSAGLALNLVSVRLPDILMDPVSGSGGGVVRSLGIPLLALSGDLSIDVFDGFSVAPTLAGIGGISVLARGVYVPVGLLGDESVARSDPAYGLGGRLHLVDESFVTPAVSLSLMRHDLSGIALGEVCLDREVDVGFDLPPGAALSYAGVCVGGGDVGEISLDLVDWSTRLVASKRILGFGAALGLGYDSFDSRLDLAFRGDEPVPGTQLTPVFRVRDEAVSSTRWTVFGNLAYTLIVGTIGLEAGWQRGAPPISGFSAVETDFDPRQGSWYGSLAGRIAL